jgi:hypothetical protein
VSGAWAFFTLFAVGLLPIFESRHEIWRLITRKTPSQARRSSVETTVDGGSIEEKADEVEVSTLPKNA